MSGSLISAQKVIGAIVARIETALHYGGKSYSPQVISAAVCLTIVFWIALKIGPFVLRMTAGLLFMGCSAYGVWYLFAKYFCG